MQAPQDGDLVASPIALRGTVRIMPFEGTLVARVYDAQGELAGETPFTVEGDIGGPGTFDVQIPYDFPSGGLGRVEVVEISARDGLVITSASVDVVLSSGLPEFSIVGTVSEVFPNARVIALAEPVDGFDVIVLTGETAIYSAGGVSITANDIEPGMRIQTIGRHGAGDTLTATLVRILAADGD